MELDAVNNKTSTEVGSYFVANYPPFSVWTPEHLPAAESALDTLASADTPVPLGLYLHIPFCRKRCKFCYFRVYTDKNSRDVDTYLDALTKEIELYSRRPIAEGRDFEFVYFGGGTPSFLSSDQLQRLVADIRRFWNWDTAREVTFECEPGTLKKSKLETIKQIGVTRLSLGVEHFDDDILELNGRAHKSPEIFRAYDWARDVGFDQLNIDLIAGMLGETQEKWQSTVEQAIALTPDSVTIYQMELPHNTVIARDAASGASTPAVAGWDQKRAWVDHAFRRFEDVGYNVSSAYTLTKPGASSEFVYRDAVWYGADMIGTGVASFSHIGGVHVQNEDHWDNYVSRLGDGELPLARAFPLTSHQKLVRELCLQLKFGVVDGDYFRTKFGTEIGETFAQPIQSLCAGGFATLEGDILRLSRAGLLRVDALLPEFFDPEFCGIRYT